MKKKGQIDNYYALHAPEQVEWLINNWVKHKGSQYKLIKECTSYPPTFPINEEDKKHRSFERYRIMDVVKDYFGEEIGIYFAFVEFYSMWLIAACVIGFVALIIE